MDIYQESIVFLGDEISFDENGLLNCELSYDANGHDKTLLLTIFKDETTLNLHMSLTSPVELPSPLPDAIAVAIGENALEPLRNGFGIGLMPGSRNITIYKIISLSNNPQSYVQTTFHQLLERMEQWHLFIEQTNSVAMSPENNGLGFSPDSCNYYTHKKGKTSVNNSD